jgi:hypothetical protein
MAEGQGRQERMGTTFMAVASIFIAGMEYLGRPAPGDFVEAEPDWYVTFTAVIHGAILLLLLIALIRLPRMVADRPGLRLPLTLLVLVGIVAAAYVLGRDFGLV